jgi:hypothetical protein
MLITSTPPPTLRPPCPASDPVMVCRRLKPGVLTLAMFCPVVARATWLARTPL